MHTVLFSSFMGFLGGIFFHSFFDFGYWFSIFFLFLGLALYVTTWVSGLQENFEIKYTSTVCMVALCLCAFGIGLLRYDISLLNQGSSVFDDQIGEVNMFVGVVTEEPDERENSVRLTVRIQTPHTKTKALVVAPLFPVFHYGDEIEITGTLQTPKNFENENGREFDYRSYLAKDGIFYQMFHPDILLVSSGKGNPVKEKLFAFKNAFLESLGRLIPEPAASLAGGLIVGAKRSLGEAWLEMFRATGIIHIVVLSGYNVTIVAEAIARTFGFLPRFVGMGLGAASIIGFAIMTGASATIIRASIMALLVIIARATGRISEITTALLFAAFFMLLHNPQILVFDPSFQLSFLATLGLIYLAPRIEKYFQIVPEGWGFRSAAVATVATQIFVLPLLLYQTGELSIVSLPVNLLILVFVPVTMLFGFLAGVVGFASTLLAMPFAFIAYALLSYELKVVELFAAMPFASVTLPAISFAVVIIIYAFYWRAFVQMNKKP